MMKAIFCLCFCGLSIALSAQSTLQTFTSPNRALQFRYSAVFVRCTPKEGQPDYWSPKGCICDDHLGSAVIVCFTYPGRSEHFLGAFFVAEVQPEECMERWPNTTCRPPPANQRNCLAGSWTWWGPGTPRSTTRGQSTRIDSVHAKLFHVSNAGLGNGEWSDVYRVFHDKKCYELVIHKTSISLGGFEPEEAEEIQKVATEDDKKYGHLLLQALHSFHFLSAARPEDGCPPSGRGH